MQGHVQAACTHTDTLQRRLEHLQTPGFPTGSLQVLQLPATVHVHRRRTADSDLAVGVCACGRLFACQCAPAINCPLVQGVTPPWPTKSPGTDSETAGTGSGSPECRRSTDREPTPQKIQSCYEVGGAYTWPSSWAMVKAVLSPLSSLMLQLLYGSHTVPNSARPGATTQVWAHHSGKTSAVGTSAGAEEHLPKVSHLSLALQMSCLWWRDGEPISRAAHRPTFALFCF